MKNTNKGFTLTELMVVVGLIAILMTLILVGINRNKVQTRDNIRISDIQSIRLALEQYRASCGVFPATLDLDTNNTRNTAECNFELGDFISQIPTPPGYGNSDGVNPQMNGEYLYVGLSSRTSGFRPCFEYNLGIQLENGKEDSYSNGQNAKYFELDHDFNASDSTYRYPCTGSGRIIEDTDNDSYGIYDFMSQKSERLN